MIDALGAWRARVVVRSRGGQWAIEDLPFSEARARAQRRVKRLRAADRLDRRQA